MRVAVAPLPGRRDWWSGVGPSLGDSQHISQGYSHECSQTRSRVISAKDAVEAEEALVVRRPLEGTHRSR